MSVQGGDGADGLAECDPHALSSRRVGPRGHGRRGEDHGRRSCEAELYHAECRRLTVGPAVNVQGQSAPKGLMLNMEAAWKRNHVDADASAMGLLFEARHTF